MARTTAHPPASRQVGLENRRRQCAACGGPTPADYRARRNVVTLNGVVALKVQVRVCHREGCSLRLKAIRAEEEGLWVLPEHEFGLDVIALIGALRYQEQRSVPSIHAALRARDVPISERSVTNLLDRYDELLALRLSDCLRLKAVTQKLGRVVLSMSALRPEVGHQVLWVARECLSSEVLAAWCLPEQRAEELVPRFQEMARSLDVPVVGVVSDGQGPVVRAVTAALPGVPHQLRQSHERFDAARPLPEMEPESGKVLTAPASEACPDAHVVAGIPAEREAFAMLCMAALLGRDLLPELLQFGAALSPVGL
ncbi:hypothetical protein OV208_26535 [Corallococcus sp. bb12-1]|uniref:hypothetical protein n=1 Tax=Corallococcus sp. bb12-1 TaxID=2996784 RepID=UPI00226F8A3D|nr:hypothetical protein [Corallococcus sp. bb12-1]MCY1044902.1 hypothetical protein [Corallococcus sp. bb12-1]